MRNSIIELQTGFLKMHELDKKCNLHFTYILITVDSNKSRQIDYFVSLKISWLKTKNTAELC